MTKYSKVAERHTSNPGLRIDWLAGVFCSNILIHVGGWRFLCVLSVCTLSCILETMLVAVVISCRSVVHCAAASLPSFPLVLGELYCSKMVGTHSCFEQSLVSISTSSNLSATVLTEVDHYSQSMAVPQAASVENVK